MRDGLKHYRVELEAQMWHETVVEATDERAAIRAAERQVGWTDRRVQTTNVEEVFPCRLCGDAFEEDDLDHCTLCGGQVCDQCRADHGDSHCEDCFPDDDCHEVH